MFDKDIGLVRTKFDVLVIRTILSMPNNNHWVLKRIVREGLDSVNSTVDVVTYASIFFKAEHIIFFFTGYYGDQREVLDLFKKDGMSIVTTLQELTETIEEFYPN